MIRRAVPLGIGAPALVLAALALGGPALAQTEGAAAQTELRLQQLEDQVRTLTGEVETQNHQIEVLNQQLEKMKSDTDMRLNDVAGKVVQEVIAGRQGSGLSRAIPPPLPRFRRLQFLAGFSGLSPLLQPAAPKKREYAGSSAMYPIE